MTIFLYVLVFLSAWSVLGVGIIAIDCCERTTKGFLLALIPVLVMTAAICLMMAFYFNLAGALTGLLLLPMWIYVAWARRKPAPIKTNGCKLSHSPRKG